MTEIIQKGWDAQRRIEERAKRVGKGKFGRVLRMARKPTRDEFSKTVFVVGLGLALIGLVGFVIYLLFQFMPGWLASLFG